MSDPVKPLPTYLLPSGRGVRLRTLDYEQVDACEFVVAGSDKLHGGQGIVTRIQFDRLVSAEGIALMVVEMTDKVGLALADLTLPTTRWIACSPDMLSGNLAKFFSTKDMVFLRSRYAAEHDLLPVEIGAILEKKVDVLPA